MEERRRNGPGRRDQDRTRVLMRRIGMLVTVVLLLAGIAVLASISTYVNSRDDERIAEEQRETSIAISREVRSILKEVRSCTVQDGECSQRSAANGANLIASSIVCTNRGYTSKEAALACVREVMSDE